MQVRLLRGGACAGRIARGAAHLTLILSFLWIPASEATTSEALCNERLGKRFVALERAYLGHMERCLRFSHYGESCAESDAAIDRGLARLARTLEDAQAACGRAVADDGVPVANFGPGDSGECASAPASLEELAACLTEASGWLRYYYEWQLDLPPVVPAAADEHKCIRKAHRSAGKAIRVGLKELLRCTKGGVKPFACPADDGEASKFGKALAKIERKVSRCKDAAGVAGRVSGRAQELCHRAIATPADLAQCLQAMARCQVCRTGNIVYEQGQDCQAFSGLVTCTREEAAAEASMFVANGGDNTVTFYTPAGEYVAGDLARSSFPVGAGPAAVVASKDTGIVYVANRDEGTVTYLNAATGEYAFGTLMDSTFVVGVEPVALVLARELGILFVANRGDGTVTLLDAVDGSYVYDTLSASTVGVGVEPRAVAVNPEDEVVYVANYGEDTVTYLKARTGEYLYGTLAASTFAVGGGPAGVAVDPAAGVVAVSNELDGTVTLLDGVTGAPARGSLAASTVATGSMPGPAVFFDLTATNASDRNFYVANAGDGTVTIIDRYFLSVSSFPSGTPGTVSATAVPEQGAFAYPLRMVDRDAGSLWGCRTAGRIGISAFSPVHRPAFLAVNPAANLLYVAGVGSRWGVAYLDATTGQYMNGALERSLFSLPIPSFVLCACTHAMAVNPAANRLYVVTEEGAVTYFDATTGAYINGTLEDSTFPAIGNAPSLAVNSEANRLYVIDPGWWEGRVLYLDATTGAYLNGTYLNSTFAVGNLARATAVNPAAGLLYVAAELDGTVVYLDAATGAYLNGTLENSTFAVGSTPTDLAVDPAANLLYVLNAGDDTITYLDATTGAYLNGSLANSTFTAGDGLADIEVNTAAGVLYVVNELGDSVTYLDAATGAYLNGTYLNSTYPVGSAPIAVAVHPAANLVYVLNRDSADVTYLDATTGAYLNGTLANSSFAVEPDPTGIVVNPSANRLYVISHQWENGVTYLDATTGEYLPPCLQLAATGSAPEGLAVLPPGWTLP